MMTGQVLRAGMVAAGLLLAGTRLGYGITTNSPAAFSTLTSGATFRVDNVTFSNFGVLSSTTFGTGVTPFDTSLLTVTGVEIDGHPGLQFTSPDLTLTGAGGRTLEVTFRGTVDSPDFILAAGLQYTRGGKLNNPAALLTFLDGTPVNNAGNNNIFQNGTKGVFPPAPSIIFSEARLNVSSNAGQTSFVEPIAFYVVSGPMPVPEPAGVGLLGLAAAALGVRLMRRRGI